jgi:glutamine cyclotransferase
MKVKLVLTGLNIILLYSCNNSVSFKTNNDAAGITSTIPLINYTVDTSFPHDTTAFTEGLLVHEGKLYESTGSPHELPQTRSLFGTVNLKTGLIAKKVELDRKKYFGEGIVFLNGKVFQLTYLTKKGFIYDAKSFKELGEFTFPSKEGWGMTTDGTYLIMSDGTPTIRFLDANSFQTVKTISVSDGRVSVDLLNELEWIKGFLYAKVYTTNMIIKIDPGTGEVVGKLDLGSLVQDAKAKYPPSLELNGIAYDSTKQKVYVTGKMWPTIYEIGFSY